MGIELHTTATCSGGERIRKTMNGCDVCICKVRIETVTVLSLLCSAEPSRAEHRYHLKKIQSVCPYFDRMVANIITACTSKE